MERQQPDTSTDITSPIKLEKNQVIKSTCVSPITELFILLGSLLIQCIYYWRLSENGSGLRNTEFD